MGLMLVTCGKESPTGSQPPEPPPPEPPPPVVRVPTRIVITPASATLNSIGQTIQLNASVMDQNGTAISGAAVTWTSSAAGVATASNQGLVTAVKNGSAVITARSGSTSATVNVTVSQTASRILIEPASATPMSIGETVQLTATVLDRNGHTVAGVSVTWTSSDIEVATVTDSGLVTTVRNGSVKITASYGAISASSQITVMIPSPGRDALVTLFNRLNGPNWTNNENWLSSLPVREWYGVATDDHERVIGLDLKNNNLTGQLPPELAELIHVRRLILTGNPELAGPIPPALITLALQELHTDETGLCAPSDVVFQSWLDAIPDANAVNCINNPDEISALVTFYHHTNGPNWTNRTNWLSNAPLGTWYGVETDGTGSVIEVTLTNNNISGIIPSEIGNLGNLQILRLDRNDLYGSIPAELGQLKSVWFLSMSGNRLSGFIPPELGEMTSLSGLSLGRNRLTGPIPAELGQLDRLRNLSLGSNRLSGTIPAELERLKNLDSLELSRNSLSGPIPSELGNLRTVRLLFLDQNQLTGTIPAELGQLNNLSVLRLQNNLLSGSLPPEMGILIRLTRLDLSNNQALNGPVPRSFVNLTLTAFDLRGTQLCVPLDDEFENWLSGISDSQVVRCGDSTVAALTSLYNGTDGPNWHNRQNWLSHLPSGDWHGVSTDNNGLVTALNLADNNLNGSLPPIMAILTELRSLNLSGNPSLTGPLPRSFLRLNLEVLQLTGTNLCVPADNEFQAWVRGITRAHASICNVSSPDREALVAFYRETNGPNWNEDTNWLSDEPLARWRGVQTDSEGRVTGLSLTDNSLTGRLPSEIGQLRHLVSLELYGNSISGPIPPELGNLSRLRSLILDGCDMQGSIPPELGQLTRLVRLSLSGNRLTGTIPAELGQLTNLTYLTVSGNELTGSIPSELGDMVNLASMFLSNNSLSGSIPRELGLLTNLRDLVLFSNRLTGPIPPEIGNIKSLVSLSVWDNRLSGRIPAELGRLSNLIGLFLSNNQLTGPIPPDLGDLHRLISLRLDNNRIFGSIPPELGHLGRLRELFLHENSLTGVVPPELGNLGFLHTLNLGGNTGLSGPLPLTFTELDLDNLNVAGTGICAPPDHGFQAWLQSLSFGRVPDCTRPDGPALYLTQAAQSLDYPVPLIAGEDALLRVFLMNEDDQYSSMPPVRATFYLNNTTVHVEDVPEEPIPPPETADEGSLSSSINAFVPGAVIQPGLEMVVEIEPDGVASSHSNMPVRVPPTGRMPVDVRDVPPLDLTLVPLLWVEDPDRSILSEIEGLTPDDDLFWPLRNLLPVGDLDISMRDAVFTSVDPVWENYPAVLSEIRAIHILDGDRGHYMGVLRSGGGAAVTGGRTFLSGLDGFTVAHELGHNLGLGHAPCGDLSLFSIDANFPYADGAIGVWGYDARSELPVSPDTKDLMSYCRPQWISDYSFIKALNHRIYVESQQVPSAQPDFTESLLLWGYVDGSGQISLKPAFTVHAPVSLPAETGPYRLTGNSADRGTLFTLDFDTEKIADGEGGFFAFTVPMDADWLPMLEVITLDGPEGTVSIDKRTGQPSALLLDSVTGRAQGILTDWTDTARDAAFNRSMIPEPGLEIVISRGVPDSAEWRP